MMVLLNSCSVLQFHLWLTENNDKNMIMLALLITLSPLQRMASLEGKAKAMHWSFLV